MEDDIVTLPHPTYGNGWYIEYKKDERPRVYFQPPKVDFQTMIPIWEEQFKESERIRLENLNQWKEETKGMTSLEAFKHGISTGRYKV